MRELTKQARGILHHKLGAFVASQILWEATHNDSAMVDEALEFMEEALNANGENNVYLSMKHSHANHAVRAWIELLGTMDETISANRHKHIERFSRNGNHREKRLHEHLSPCTEWFKL